MDQLGKEKIISLLQDTILSLCQRSYSGSIEVDGIICITSLYSTDQHVVKIHQKLNSVHSDIPLNSGQEHLTLDLHVEGEQTPHLSAGNRVLYGKGTRGKAKTKNVRERKVQRKTGNLATKKTDVAASGSTNNVDKYPYLMQTLCGTPAEVVMTNLEQNSEDSSHSENMTSSREDTPVRDMDQSSPKDNGGLLNNRSKRFDNFWKAVLKNRMAEKEKCLGKTDFKSAPEKGIHEVNMVQVKQEPEDLQEDNTQQEQMTTKSEPITNTHLEESNNINSDHERNFSRESSTENMFRDGNSQDSNEYTYSTNQNDGYDSNHGNNDNQKSTKSEGMYITMREGGMYIKQEPVWEDEYSQNSSQSRSNHDSNEVRGHDNQENMSTFTNDPSGLVDEADIKKEPDIGESIMETGDLQKTDGTEASSGRNSILLKILKGKSLKEAYKHSDTSGTFPDQVDSPLSAGSFPSNQESSDKRDNPTDQDNSLLYRLPFVSFQDLFSPGKNSTPFPPIDTNNSASRLKASTSSPASKNNTAFETLARTLLETNENNSSRSKRSSSARLSGQFDYQYDYDTDEDSEDDENDIDDDPYDSSYIPYREDDTDSPPRKMRVRQVRKKTPTPKSVPPPVGGSLQVGGSKRKKAEYTCGLCGEKFDSIGERNRHEERELRERGLDQPEFVKCPLCKGFFADEASRNKHMVERHQIAAPHGL